MRHPRRNIHSNGTLRWLGAVICFVASIGAALWFCYALHAAWNTERKAAKSCALGNLEKLGNDYVQFEILDQDATLPIFHGNILMILPTDSVAEVSRISVSTDPELSNAGNLDFADLVAHKDFNISTLKKPVTTEFVSQSGSHRNFPFDSAKIEFGMSWSPQVPVQAVMLSNYNSSFYLPCRSVSAKVFKPGALQFSFELKRNPLVQVTAVVLLAGAFIFVLAIVLFVKTESLPTAIASYFFSLWSVRSILSAEIKTFPTILDIAVLGLSVLLVVMVGIRLAVQIKRNNGRSS